jgi:hypothetical protein
MDGPKPKFRLYVDEVGNPDLESSDNPNHRFLSLTGIILELSVVRDAVNPAIEEIKRRYFGSHPDDPIIFHRKEMINFRGPFKPLADENVRANFNRELLGLLEHFPFTVISVCIDKKAHKERYSTWRYDPYHYCLAVLLERFMYFLERHNSTGDVMAESRGGKEDRRLQASYTRLWEQGTDYVEPVRFQRSFTSKQLKVKPKALNVSGLQLADLIAHPSRDEILSDHGLLTKAFGPFGIEVIKLLQAKYDGAGGKCFGKKFL